MFPETDLSIYSNLFRYRPRPKRKPLEDFLSEVLVDLLNRLSLEHQLLFVADVLLKDTPISGAWRNLAVTQPTMSLRWETQRAIRGGIIDILLTLDGEPVLVVENKIGAIVRAHAADEAGDDKTAGSRSCAGRWEPNTNLR